MPNSIEGHMYGVPTPSQEKESKPRRGLDVNIRNIWQRHTQKASGEVYAANTAGISSSNISPGGIERSRSLGKTFTASKHGAKGYKTEIIRTEETFDAIMEGYHDANPDAPIRERVALREELSPMRVPAFDEIYNAKFNANKKALLESRGLKPEDFSKLSPDEQEAIAETVEEPVVAEWLDDPNSEMAKAFPPRIQAARFAALFDRRHERMAKKLNNGSEIDLFHNTHKTATEPFLISGALIRKADGERVTKLEQVGGSLKILGNWESDVATDSEGRAQLKIIIRDQEYLLDPKVYRQLVEEGQTEAARKLEAKIK